MGDLFIESIHIAVAFHDEIGDYARHAGVTLASVFANASRPICAHVLHDESLSTANREKLEKIATDFRQQIRFYHVGLSEVLARLNCRNFTRGCLYRLLLHQVLPMYLDKVIYLDCDIVAELDVKDLWEMNLDGLPVAAVNDQGIFRWTRTVKRQVKATGLSLSSYFNSGVMILDLERLRSGYDLLKVMNDFLQASYFLPFVDQDLLNYLFQSQCYRLNEKYNRLVRFSSAEDAFEDRIPSLWHFAGEKPWNQYVDQWDGLYWKYLLHTPWRQEALFGLELVHRKRQGILSSSCWRVMQKGKHSENERKTISWG